MEYHEALLWTPEDGFSRLSITVDEDVVIVDLVIACRDARCRKYKVHYESSSSIGVCHAAVNGRPVYTGPCRESDPSAVLLSYIEDYVREAAAVAWLVREEED